MPAEKLPPKANESDFVSHDDAEDLQDRGDDTPDEEEEEEEKGSKNKPAKKMEKKPAKKEEPEEGEEEEEEPEGEEEEEPEGEEEDEKKTDKRVVNRQRFDRMKTQRDRAASEAEELREKLRAIEDAKTDTAKKKLEDLQKNLDGLYEKVEDLRADGKPKEAAKVQREIDEIRGKLTTSQATYYATVEALKQADTRVYNTMVRELEVHDPRFDSKSDDYDPEMVDDVADMTEAFEAKGMSAPDALRKAVKAVLREDVFASGTTLKRPEKKAEKKVEPKKTDLKKNLDAASKQPPEEPGAVKEKGGKINFAALSEKEFDALPESTKAKYRGDFD